MTQEEAIKALTGEPIRIHKTITATRMLTPEEWAVACARWVAYEPEEGRTIAMNNKPKGIIIVGSF